MYSVVHDNQQLLYKNAYPVFNMYIITDKILLPFCSLYFLAEYMAAYAQNYSFTNVSYRNTQKIQKKNSLILASKIWFINILYLG